MRILAANTILYCHKFEACAEFYEHGLAWPVNLRNDWFIEFRAAKDACVSVADASRATIESAGGQGLTLTFRVADADEAQRELSERGVRTTRPRDHPWGARTFYVFDPEGRRIEFWSSAD